MLTAKLRDPDKGVRLDAARAIVSLDRSNAEAIAVLEDTLCDDYYNNRLIAAEALGQVGFAARRSVPALTSLLWDSDGYVRKSAADALKKIAPDAAARAGLR